MPLSNDINSNQGQRIPIAESSLNKPNLNEQLPSNDRSKVSFKINNSVNHYQVKALKSLKNNGKSFDFARVFLGEEKGNAAARLYSFCRYCDDIADDYSNKSIAFKLLTNLQYQIKTGHTSDPQVADFTLLCHQYQIDRMLAIELIDGLIQDQQDVLLVTESDLINYAYKVAGVVGLMMAPILGAKQTGHLHAIDLGIAMQLTNIARDVVEDAQMGRRYIPGNWVNHLTPKQILTPTNLQSDLVKSSVKRLLTLAESYYESGLDGLFYLPNDSQKAIAIAAKVYRRIGTKLEARDYDVYQGRVTTSKFCKIAQAMLVLCASYFTSFKTQAPTHQSKLHRFLQSSQFSIDHQPYQL